MSLTQSQKIEGNVEQCLRKLTNALGRYDHEVKDGQIVVDDRGHRVIIELTYTGDREVGSLDLPMTRVDYAFEGHSQEEMNEFMSDLSQHMVRTGG